MEDFIAEASPRGGLEPCVVAGCAGEAITPPARCATSTTSASGAVHRGPNALSTAELAEWVASEVPGLGAHQFSLAPLDELVRHELLYALQRRDKMPPPLDPVSVRILISRLVGCTSMREADPEVICESGGTQYNSAIRGLFCDLARHLERAWVAVQRCRSLPR